MILWDVNLWVYAFREDSPVHGNARAVLQRGLRGNSFFLFSPLVASSFLRLVTNPKIFTEPSGHAEAWEFVDTLEAHPNSRYIEIDRMTFGIFKHISLIRKAEGNKVPDAFLAAIAIRHNCRLITADQGFSGYPGLQVEII